MSGLNKITMQNHYFTQKNNRIISIILLIIVAAIWSYISWNRDIEHIATSDTTDTLFSVVGGYSDTDNGTRISWSWYNIASQISDDFSDALEVNKLFDSYNALFFTYIRSVHKVTGNPLDAYRILVFPLTLIFLLGGFLLFRKLGNSYWVAALLAVLMSFPLTIPLAGEQFGMGPVTIYSRRHLMTAFIPILTYIYYTRLVKGKSQLLTFLLIGLASNLHASGFLFAEILGFLYLMYCGASWVSVSKLMAYIGVLLVGGFIALGRVYSELIGLIDVIITAMLPVANAGGMREILVSGIPAKFTYLFFPWHIYGHWPAWLTVIIAIFMNGIVIFTVTRAIFRMKINLILLFAACILVMGYINGPEMTLVLALLVYLAFIGGVSREGPSQLFAHYLVLSVFAVSICMTLIFQAGYLFIDGFPLVFSQLRASRFVWLGYFVLLSVVLANINLSSKTSFQIKIFWTVLALVLLVELRHAYRSHIRIKFNQEQIAFYDVARWAKKNTLADAKILVASSQFGLISERKIVFGDKDTGSNKLAKSLRWGSGFGYRETLKYAREYDANHMLLRTTKNNTLPPKDKLLYVNQYYALSKL